MYAHRECRSGVNIFFGDYISNLLRCFVQAVVFFFSLFSVVFRPGLRGFRVSSFLLFEW